MKTIQRIPLWAVLTAAALVSAASATACGSSDTASGAGAFGGATFGTGGATGTGASGGTGGGSTGGTAPATGGAASTGGASGSGAAAASGGATSTGGTGAGGTTSTVSATEACVKYVEAACERLVGCGIAGDVESCLASVGPTCPDYFFGPGSVRTVDGMVACADDILHWPCGLDLLPPCVVAGTRAGGEPCVAPSQCASHACGRSNGPCGECFSTFAAGEDCRYETNTKTCPEGTACSNSGACEPAQPGTPAAPAGGWRTCRCDDPTCALAPPACRTTPLVGEACDPNTPACHASADCVNGVCVAKGTPDYFAQTCGAP